MTAPIPNHSLSWDRVLPAPPALLNGHANDSLPRRSSSLLQHHLLSSKDLVESSKDRRSTVPSISYQLPYRISPVPALPPRASQDSSGSDQHPTGPLTRKRAASLMADESKTRETSPATTQDSTSETTNQFCLCQPDPKIPRPRNAFILYRQHHQAAVVAKHPGLPNPEISKIIGEEWRALPTKTKSQWKALAEEEKLRHQQQYPDYRYQPRRLGRNGNTQTATASNTTGPSGNCLRCGGKTMNPPMTPHTPGLQPSGGPAAGRRSPSAISGAGTARRPQPLGHPNLHRQVPYAISSPSPPGSAMTRIRPFGEVFAGGPPSISEAEYRARMGSQPVSPDPKRRRYNGPGVAVPGRDVHMTSPTGLYQHGHQHSPKRMSLPRPGDGTVHARYATQGYQQRPGYRYVSMDSRDPSLTLAPLQRPSISSDSTASGPKRVGSVASAECQIMSIPAINKLRLLSKAAPPLPYPGTSDTGTETTRGAILAIEGSEEDVRQVSEWLAEFLKTQSKEFLVRAFLGPDISAVMVGAKSDEEVDMVGTQQQRYLKAISEWHWVSKEVVRYVTSMPEPPTPQRQQPRSEKQKKEGQAEEREEREGEEMDVDTTPSPSSHPSSSSPSPTSASVSVVSPVSPRTITQTERLSLQNNNPPKTKSDKTPIPSPQPTTTDNPVSTRPFPIALLPRYQLSTVDTASLAMPITDSYAPTDHWQWAAALWRGCVGPDVTIVVQEAAVGASGSVGGGGGGNGVSGVEVRLGEGDVRAVVVRKGGSNGGGGSGIEPFLLRRVGFEIVEFLRK